MTTPTIALRDAIAARLTTLSTTAGYMLPVRLVRLPQVQPDRLPSVAVYTMSERDVPDGDGNAGPLAFDTEATFGVSVVRGFNDPLTLHGILDSDAAAIKAALFADPTFTAFGADPLFESVMAVNTQRLFPTDGETYFAELRIEITFRFATAYEPVIPDPLETVRMTTRPDFAGPDTPSVTTVITLPRT